MLDKRIYYAALDKDHNIIENKQFKNAKEANDFFDSHEDAQYFAKITEEWIIRKSEVKN